MQLLQTHHITLTSIVERFGKEGSAAPIAKDKDGAFKRTWCI